MKKFQPHISHQNGPSIQATKLNAGLRYEHTKTFISTQETRGVVDRNFGNIFPSLFYKKTFSEHLGVYLGYSRRITRPTFNDMAPFVFILDPNTFISGNPALKPAIIDGVKLDVNIKRAIVTFDYSHSKNEIANFQPEIDPISKKQIFRSQNLDFLKLYSLTLSVPWILNDWWEIHWNSGGFFRQFKTQHLQENTTRDLYNFNLNLTNNIRLPKDFMLELTGFYDSKMMMGIWEFRPMGSLNIGIQKTLKENRGTLRLAIDDLLYTNVWKMNTKISPEVVSHFEIDFHNQSIRLTYNRAFGNKKLKDVSIKSGSEEERKRIQ